MTECYTCKFSRLRKLSFFSDSGKLIYTNNFIAGHVHSSHPQEGLFSAGTDVAERGNGKQDSYQTPGPYEADILLGNGS